MLLSITVGTETVQLPKGTGLRELYDQDANIPFQCLKGRCGRCLVRLVEGNLGPSTVQELAFLKLVGISPGSYRLLCQSTLEADSIVELP
jgi:ferredoxin